MKNIFVNFKGEMHISFLRFLHLGAGMGIFSSGRRTHFRRTETDPQVSRVEFHARIMGVL
jgi:hypothetical protein